MNNLNAVRHVVSLLVLLAVVLGCAFSSQQAEPDNRQLSICPAAPSTEVIRVQLRGDFVHDRPIRQELVAVFTASDGTTNRLVIWNAPWVFHSDGTELAFSSGPGHRWGIASAFHPGGGRGLLVWRGNESFPSPSSAAPRELLTVQLEGAVPDSSIEHPVCLDLFGPQLVWRDDQLYIIAVGVGNVRDEDMRDRSLVWVARVPQSDGGENELPRGSIVGRCIADGTEPRIGSRAGNVIVAARIPRNEEGGDGTQQVGFYRSVDMVQWTRDDTFQCDIAVRSNYDVFLLGETAWMISTASDQPSSPTLWRQSAPSRQWEQQENAALDSIRLRSATDRLWLLSPVDASMVPRLAYAAEDGSLSVIQL